MTKQDVQSFADAVRRKCPDGINPESVDFALRHYEEIGKCDRRHEANCIALARLWQESSPQSPREEEAGPRQAGTFEVVSWPESGIDSRLLADEIHSDIEEWRQLVFGRPEPPFESSYDKAVNWIEEERLRWEEKSAACDPAWGKALISRFESLADDFSDYLGRPTFLKLSIMALSYLRPDGSANRLAKVKICNDSPLISLKQLASSMSDRTGFSEPAIIAYALSGIRPSLASIELSKQLAYFFRPPETIITIRKRHVRRQDLLDAYRMIESFNHLNVADDKDRLIVSSLLDQGGVPPRGKGRTEVLRKVLERLRASGMVDPPPTIDAVRMRIGRLKKKGFPPELLRRIGI